MNDLTIEATSETVYPEALAPTMYFIGVTTHQSAIRKIFPIWARHLGIEEAQLVGVNCRLHDDPEVYRRVVQHIKRDAGTLGALITTHKLDVLRASRNLFDHLDHFARLLGEISSIAKKGETLMGQAKDPITGGLSLKAFLPHLHWARTRAEALIFGAGGAATALTVYLMDAGQQENRPSRIVITDISSARIDQIRRVHDRLDSPLPIEYRRVSSPKENSDLLAQSPPASLVVNATGLGKDRPGSPISDDAKFPEGAFVWEFNYRGDLLFLKQARSQQLEKNLTLEDGWTYFIHGWTQVIAEVFGISIPSQGPRFEELSRAARERREV